MQDETDILGPLLRFDHLAGLLGMPLDERLGILNISAEQYSRLQRGLAGITAELRRRLAYVVPVMGRMAANSPVVRLPVRLVAA